jgi:polycystin 1L3
MNRFTITVNITSLEKSLIVTVEPESPLLMTLYLGFQDQPGHTHFHLNITLPKGQLCHKGKSLTRCTKLTLKPIFFFSADTHAIVRKKTECSYAPPSSPNGNIFPTLVQDHKWEMNLTQCTDFNQVSPTLQASISARAHLYVRVYVLPCILSYVNSCDQEMNFREKMDCEMDRKTYV